MAEVLVTLICATEDRQAVARALRQVTKAPIHARAEAVMGLDFSDAGTAEQVAGQLARHALELIVEEGAVAAIVEAAAGARRRLPVRWHAVKLLQRGRIA